MKDDAPVWGDLSWIEKPSLISKDSDGASSAPDGVPRMAASFADAQGIGAKIGCQ